MNTIGGDVLVAINNKAIDVRKEYQGLVMEIKQQISLLVPISE
jgi:hypothetical protein